MKGCLISLVLGLKNTQIVRRRDFCALLHRRHKIYGFWLLAMENKWIHFQPVALVQKLIIIFLYIYLALYIEEEYLKFSSLLVK